MFSTLLAWIAPPVATATPRLKAWTPVYRGTDRVNHAGRRAPYRRSR